MTNQSGPVIKTIKIVIAVLALLIAVVVGWLSLSLVWYPSYDEIDQQTLTQEADILLARCRDNPIRSDEGGSFILHVENQTPYIYSLVSDKERHLCSEGVNLRLWDDYLVSSAGLYIARVKGEVPEKMQPFVTHLSGRVYKWHAGRQL